MLEEALRRQRRAAGHGVGFGSWQRCSGCCWLLLHGQRGRRRDGPRGGDSASRSTRASLGPCGQQCEAEGEQEEEVVDTRGRLTAAGGVARRRTMRCERASKREH